MRIGLSSRSCPPLDAVALAAYMKARNSATADLRAEKRQPWEQQGVKPFIDAGLRVSFIGLTVHLGDAARSLDTLRHAVLPYSGQRLKVFASPSVYEQGRLDYVRQQISCLASKTSGPCDILVETHRGMASIADLVSLCSDTGIRIVLDMQGFALIMMDYVRDLRAIAPFTAAMQVKGFDWVTPAAKAHRALTKQDIDRIAFAADLIGNDDLDITVETLAGTADHDIELLLHRFT